MFLLSHVNTYFLEKTVNGDKADVMHVSRTIYI
jgi:hypothetical protein